MIGPVQMCYYGLFIVNNSDPLIESLSIFKYASGYNIYFDSHQGRLPNRLFAINYTSSVIINLNLMIIVFVIPPILAFIFYRIHLASTKWRIRM